MSVDFYGCSCCGESKYEEYVGWCTKCGAALCTSCVVNDDIESSYAYEYGVRFDGSKEMMEKYDITQKEIDEGTFEVGELIDDTAIDPKYCPYCQGDEINEIQFLSFLIKRSGKSREELEDEFRELK